MNINFNSFGFAESYDKTIFSMRQVLGASALGRLKGMGWGGRWEGDQDGETCKPMADPCQCMAKITIILQSN